MFHRKSILKNFKYFLKSINGLWIPAVFFIDIFIPIISLFIYKTSSVDIAKPLVEQFMFFFIPLFSVWVCVFVGELFFSEKTKDVFFFYGNKKKFFVITSFYLTSLINSIAVICLHFYCLEDVFGVVVKMLCIITFYFGLSTVVLKLSKSSSITIMILLIYALLNSLPTVQVNFFLFYDNGEPLDLLVFLMNYLPLLILGMLGPVFVFTDSRKKTSKKMN